MKKLLLITVLGSSLALADNPVDDIDSEFFELGIYTGFLSVQDFTTEPIIGVRATFHASEDYFVQFNAAMTNVDKSSFEENQGSLFSGSDRDYTYYNFLVGYNLLQGEVFPSGPKAYWSNLYLVAGVGNTDFGGEDAFTWTVGAGYKINLSRRYVISVDLRDHSYKSNLIAEDDRVHNVELTAGFNYLF